MTHGATGTNGTNKAVSDQDIVARIMSQRDFRAALTDAVEDMVQNHVAQIADRANAEAELEERLAAELAPVVETVSCEGKLDSIDTILDKMLSLRMRELKEGMVLSLMGPRTTLPIKPKKRIYRVSQTIIYEPTPEFAAEVMRRARAELGLPPLDMSQAFKIFGLNADGSLSDDDPTQSEDC